MSGKDHIFVFFFRLGTKKKKSLALTQRGGFEKLLRVLEGVFDVVVKGVGGFSPPGDLHTGHSADTFKCTTITVV